MADDKRFFQKVYSMVQQVPEGYVATYGQIACLIGHPRAARFVGYALHANPDPATIPCHRIVFRNGSLASGYAFGGAGEQRRRLKCEGVIFLPNGYVDMSQCLWKMV